jgi:adiponectin receptor
MPLTISTATGVSLNPTPSPIAAPRQRRRLSAPVPPTHWSGLGLRLHHSADTSPRARAVDALDLSTASPTQTLASLRWLVLTYLEGLERKLLGMAKMVGTPGAPFSSLPSTPTLDDARQWASTALDMLSDIRAEVMSHFPTLPTTNVGCGDILAYLPDIELPQLPDWSSFVDEDFLAGPRNSVDNIDLEYYPQCMEVLSTHLTTFREHLSSLSVPFPSLYTSEASSSFPFASVAEALETLVMAVQSQLEESHKGDEDKLRPRPLSLRRKSMVERGAEFMIDVRDGFEANVDAMREQQEEMMESIGEQLSSMREGFDHMKEGFHENLTHMRDNFNHELDLLGHELTAIRDEIGHEIDVLKDEMQVMASEVRAAVQRSFDGVHLISYADLPQDWRNNPFVTTGYRFIPIERWSLLIKSVFAFHNETRELFISPLWRVIYFISFSQHPYPPDSVPHLVLQPRLLQPNLLLHHLALICVQRHSFSLPTSCSRLACFMDTPHRNTAPMAGSHRIIYYILYVIYLLHTVVLLYNSHIARLVSPHTSLPLRHHPHYSGPWCI